MYEMPYLVDVADDVNGVLPLELLAAGHRPHVDGVVLVELGREQEAAPRRHVQGAEKVGLVHSEHPVEIRLLLGEESLKKTIV